MQVTVICMLWLLKAGILIEHSYVSLKESSWDLNRGAAI